MLPYYSLDPNIDAAALKDAMAAAVRRCLEKWVEINSRYYDRGVTLRMAKDTEPYLKYFLEDNSDKTPEELEDIAAWLLPGGVHNSGLFLRIIMNNGVLICPRLMAAIATSIGAVAKRGFSSCLTRQGLNSTSMSSSRRTSWKD